MKIVKGKPVALPDGTEIDSTTKLGIFDSAMQQIPYVMSFDTETCEIEMMVKLKDEEGEGDDKVAHLLRGGEDMKPLIAKFICPGAFVMTEKGEIIK